MEIQNSFEFTSTTCNLSIVIQINKTFQYAGWPQLNSRCLELDYKKNVKVDITKYGIHGKYNHGNTIHFSFYFRYHLQYGIMHITEKVQH